MVHFAKRFLLLICVLSICFFSVSCDEDEKNDFGQSTENEENTVKESQNGEFSALVGDYVFSFSSNGDGTCRIVRIIARPTLEKIDLRVPEYSPMGDRVVSWLPGTFSTLEYNNVPRVIAQQDYEINILVPMEKAVAEQKLDRFYYDKFLSCYEFKDLSELQNDSAKEQQLALYPILSVTPIYVLQESDERNLNWLSVYLREYAAFTEEDCFASNAALWKMAVDAGVDQLGFSYVRHAEQISSVAFSEGMLEISDRAFANCSNLKYVVLPTTITQIGEAAFDQCDQLERIYYLGTSEQWSEKSFSEDVFGDRLICFYSEVQPVEPGMYWHFVNDIPTLW